MNVTVVGSKKDINDNRKLEKDEKGYYKVVLGAYGVHNTVGDFYSSTGIKEMITSMNSFVGNTLYNGKLYGETDHPQFVKGMSKTEWYNRNKRILKSCIEFHIREVIVTETDTPAELPGEGNIILIHAWIKPEGPGGPALQSMLDNTEINVCFSVRSFTDDKLMSSGRYYKRTLTIVTWDGVPNGGISKATTWSTLSIESTNEKLLPHEGLIIPPAVMNDMVSSEAESIKLINDDIVSRLNSTSQSIAMTW